MDYVFSSLVAYFISTYEGSNLYIEEKASCQDDEGND